MTVGDPEVFPETLAVLTVRGTLFDWAIDARVVRWVLPAEEWEGAAPIEVATYLGAPWRSPGGELRVLVIWTEAADVPVYAQGRVGIRDLSWADICDLPELMRSNPRTSVIDGVVFGAQGRSLILLNTRDLA